MYEWNEIHVYKIFKLSHRNSWIVPKYKTMKHQLLTVIQALLAFYIQRKYCVCVSTNKYILFYIKNIFPERKHIFKEIKYFHELLSHTHIHTCIWDNWRLSHKFNCHIYIYIHIHVYEWKKQLNALSSWVFLEIKVSGLGTWLAVRSLA